MSMNMNLLFAYIADFIKIISLRFLRSFSLVFFNSIPYFEQSCFDRRFLGKPFETLDCIRLTKYTSGKSASLF